MIRLVRVFSDDCRLVTCVFGLSCAVDKAFTEDCRLLCWPEVVVLSVFTS